MRYLKLCALALVLIISGCGLVQQQRMQSQVQSEDLRAEAIVEDFFNCVQRGRQGATANCAPEMYRKISAFSDYNTQKYPGLKMATNLYKSLIRYDKYEINKNELTLQMMNAANLFNEDLQIARTRAADENRASSAAWQQYWLNVQKSFAPPNTTINVNTGR